MRSNGKDDNDNDDDLCQLDLLQGEANHQTSLWHCTRRATKTIPAKGF
jgi:hypothetical protein